MRGKDMLEAGFLRRDKTNANMKDIHVDVQTLKKWFVSSVGATWSAATAEKRNSDLGISSAMPPWTEVHRIGQMDRSTEERTDRQ